MNAYEIAAKRISAGARTEKDLVDFLCKKGIDRKEARQVVEEFKEDGYIDDSRYSKDYIRYGQGKGWGRTRIVRELIKKGVEKSLIDNAFEELEEEEGPEENGEEERALQVIEKMMRGKNDDLSDEDEEEESHRLDEKTRSRIARRLFDYGYSSSVIYGAIRRYEESLNRG